MQKLHQFIQTCKFESGNYKIFDISKANFIREYFKRKKDSYLHKFKAEYEALKSVFGDMLCNELKIYYKRTYCSSDCKERRNIIETMMLWCITI